MIDVAKLKYGAWLSLLIAVTGNAAPSTGIKQLLDEIGYRIEVLQEKADRPPVTNTVVVTNTVYITNGSPVIVTNIPAAPLPVTTNEEGLRVEFELLQDVDPPNGNPQGLLVASPGVEVFAVWTEGPYGTLHFKFHPTLDGVRLYKRERGVSIRINLPPPDNQWHKFIATCDLRRIAALRDSVFTLVKNDYNSTTNVLYIGNSHNGWATDPPYSEGSRLDGSDRWNANVKYRNIVVSQFPVKHPGARYSHITWIGNSSQPQFGQGVHSGFHPYLKFVCIGTNIVAHNGYDEGRHQLKRFSVDNPQFVNARFGNGGRTLGLEPSGIPVDLASSGGLLYVKTADGLVDSYNPDTLAPVALRQTFFPADESSTWNGVIARVDFENDQVVIGGVAVGQRGGYKVNGIAVTLDKFGHYYFDGPNPTRSGFASFQRDGRIWISDAATSRYLRFQSVEDGKWVPDGTVIQFVPHTSYVCSVDQNDPNRVFSRYLEFHYDYAQNFWTLIRNWEPKQGDGMHDFMDGFHTVRTVNDKTMAIVNYNSGPRRQLVELSETGIVKTVHTDLHPDWRLEADGQVTYWKEGQGVASFWSSDFKTEKYLGSAPVTNGSPVWMIKRIVGTDQVITYAPQANHPGPHLGSARAGAWIWPGHRAQRGPNNGLGNFDSYCGHWTDEEQIINGVKVKVHVWKYAYAGDMVPPVIVGDRIFIHAYEEFYRESGQGNQTQEWDALGNFIGQFGTMAFDYTDLAAPLSASNSKSIDAAEVTGEMYIFLGNEQGVGVQVAKKQ